MIQFRSTLSTTLSDSDFIKKALDNIPKCNSEDRRRQRVFLNILLTWSRLAEKHNISYWITYGTLVGYVQRGGLLPHDGDTDIAMMTDDVPRLINISQTDFSSKYELIVHPQWNIVGATNRSYFPDKDIDFVAPNARFINKKTRDHIDIFPAYDFNPLYSNKATGKQPSENLTEYDTEFNWLSYPRNWTYPLQTRYFSGLKLSCPAQPEKMVVALYGIKALTTSDTKCANGNWVDND